MSEIPGTTETEDVETYDAEILADAYRGIQATGASVWAREIVDALAQHIDRESQLLREYQRYAATGPKAVRYLVRMIVEDEARHHRVLAELADTIAWESVGSPTATIPDLPTPHHPVTPGLLPDTTRLLAAEKQDLKELGQLRKRLADVADTTVWALLLDMMEMDTGKHITILRFIADHLGH